MPVYTYVCPNGHEFDEPRRIAERNAATRCSCGETAQRGLEAPRGHSDLEPYFDEHIVPVGSSLKGLWVTSRRRRRELLRAHGLSEAYGKGWL